MKYLLIIITLYTSDHIEIKSKEACDIAATNIAAQAKRIGKPIIVTCEWNGVNE